MSHLTANILKHNFGNYRYWISSLVLLLVFVAWGFGQENERFPLQKRALLPPNYYLTQFNNGLSVLCVERFETPVVSIALAVKGGALSKTNGFEGIPYTLAKFVQHHFNNEAMRVGAEWKASQESEHFLFQYNVYQDYWGDASLLLSKLCTPPTIDTILLKLTAVEFAKQNILPPPEDVFRADLDMTLWHKYYKRKQLAPHYTDLRNLTPERLKNYWQKHFVPTEALLIFVGPIQATQAFERANLLFGNWQVPNLSLQEKPWQIPHNDTSFTTIHEDTRAAILTLAWRMPPTTLSHIVTTDVLARLVQMPDTRFDKNIRQKNLAYSVRARYEPSAQNAAFYLTFIPVPGKFELLLESISKEMTACGQGTTFSKREIDNARPALEAQLQLAQHIHTRMPAYLAKEWSYGHLGNSFTYLNTLDKLTQDSLATFFSDYCLKQPTTIGLLTSDELNIDYDFNLSLKLNSAKDSIALPNTTLSLESIEKIVAKSRIYFEKDTLYLTDSIRQNLQTLADKLYEFPDLVVYIDGYVATSDNPEKSLDMAAFIKNYLLKTYGISPDRLLTRGYRSFVGDEKYNRRIEFKIK